MTDAVKHLLTLLADPTLPPGPWRDTGCAFETVGANGAFVQTCDEIAQAAHAAKDDLVSMTARRMEVGAWLEARGLPANYPLLPGRDLPWGWVVFDAGMQVIGHETAPEGSYARLHDDADSARRWDHPANTDAQRAAALKLARIPHAKL